MPPPSSTKTPGVAAATAAAATSMQYVEPEAGLSVIMEASREYRCKIFSLSLSLSLILHESYY